MRVRRSGDSGQAFPTYIAAVAGLLFVAFAYFAVGQATSTRNGAQTAADAAALAAAQDARAQLRDKWLEVLVDPALWDGILQGDGYFEGPACRRADDLAGSNGAEVVPGGCTRLVDGFKVTVSTTGTIGRSIVPGTESQHVTASAEAVIEPNCSFEAPDPATSSPSPPQSPTATPADPGGEEEEEPGPTVGITCDGRTWDIEIGEIDPEDPVLPDASDLFTVRLTG
ncbi:pilus assembly protein TadG-related protein [Streptomyces sp. NPDC087908]|uniref:pilus assembly protein TadG-related protein n=1 Tax=Streptomyces sp. NPDC087908 TaxID=3365820 RepID=UPI00380F247E